jgi:hypothetical protein
VLAIAAVIVLICPTPSARLSAERHNERAAFARASNRPSIHFEQKIRTRLDRHRKRRPRSRPRPTTAIPILLSVGDEPVRLGLGPIAPANVLSFAVFH